MAAIKKDRRRKQLFLISGLVTLYIFTAPFLLKGFSRLWDIKPHAYTTTNQYSCVIVLGGFSGSGGENGGHFGFAADRFIQGVKLLTTKHASHILITGGNGSLNPGSYREATWARLQLQKLNIPDSLILAESNSKNTIENALFSKALLAKRHLLPPYLLVTSAVHMRRSLMIFKNADVDVVPYTSNYMFSDDEGFLSSLIPAADILAAWNFYSKEVVGYAVNYFK